MGSGGVPNRQQSTEHRCWQPLTRGKGRRNFTSGFSSVRPAGRTHFGFEVPCSLGKGSVSLTARVSIVRWNLEEEVGKAGMTARFSAART